MEKGGLPSWIRGVCGDGSRQYPSPATGPDLKERDSKIGPVKRKATSIPTPSDRKTGREDEKRTNSRLGKEKSNQRKQWPEQQCQEKAKEGTYNRTQNTNPHLRGWRQGRGCLFPVTLAAAHSVALL